MRALLPAFGKFFPLIQYRLSEMKKHFLILAFLVPTLVMAQSDTIITERFLQSFADAFNAHDLDAIMSHMTHDCVFQASAGPDFDGETFEGQSEVRKAFENVFITFEDAHWAKARHFVLGNRGFSEWTFTGTKSDGSKLEVTGCDLFTFRDGKIAVKNSYRKNRTTNQ
jgi:ketosteroid isomerase-like protein